jgi:hypothetical protein
MTDPKAGAGPRASEETPGAALYGMYLVSLGACLAGNLFMRIGADAGWVSQRGQLAIGLVSALPLVAAAFLFWRLLRSELDEMLQRVVLEGLAFALVVFVPIAGIYANLRTAGAWIPRLDAADIMLAPGLLVAIGIAIARRRYQ